MIVRGYVMTIFLTVISGTLVFVLSQYFMKFILEPIFEVKNSVKELQFYLISYKPEITSIFVTQKDRNDLAKKIRNIAAKICTEANNIPFYNYLYKLFNHFPEYNKLYELKVELIGLSNFIISDDKTDLRSRYNKRIEKIEEILDFNNIKD